MSVVHRGLTGVIFALRHKLRNNGWVSTSISINRVMSPSDAVDLESPLPAQGSYDSNRAFIVCVRMIAFGKW